MMLFPCASSALAFTKTSKADSIPILDILSMSCMEAFKITPHEISQRIAEDTVLDLQGSSGFVPLTNLKKELNEVRIAARPMGLALFFGDRFYRFHVLAGLRQNVVQIVAQADQREALFQELAHAAGAEQEQAQNHIV